MNYRKAMYIVIAIVCIWSIAVGVQGAINKKTGKKPSTTNTVVENKNTTEEPTIPTDQTQEELKKEFDKCLTNQLFLENYNRDAIEKLDDEKEIIYTYSKQIKNDVYDINVNFPRINMKGDYAEQIEKESMDLFIGKGRDIIQNAKEQTIYIISYVAYVNEDILSIIIKATLKEGNNAQRVIVKTYNMNLKTGKEASINDMLVLKKLDKDEVTEQIKETVTAAMKEASSIQETGYDVYTRNLKDPMYEVENLETFYLNQEGKLCIIFAYGNTKLTSEMDIVKI